MLLWPVRGWRSNRLAAVRMYLEMVARWEAVKKVISARTGRAHRRERLRERFWASILNIPTQLSTDLHATLLSVARKDLEAGVHTSQGGAQKTLDQR